MQKLVNRIFRRYGIALQIQGTSGLVTLYGFVQHTATSARKHLLPEYSPLGQIPQGHYLMLLPANEARLDQLILYNGKWHIVRRVERVWLGSAVIYDWVLCEEQGGADTWGN